MLISNGSRQCVLKLKVYSDKRANSSPRSRRKLNESKNDQDRELSNLNIDVSTSQLTESNENHSLLGRLLNCKPCRQVTDTQKRKIVCFSLLKKNPKRNTLSSRKMQNVIGKIVKRIYIGNIRRLNFLIKLKKLIKYKKNSMVYQIGKDGIFYSKKTI